MVQAFIENPQALVDEFNEMAKIAQIKAFITVGIELQKEELEVINKYLLDLLELKKEFVSRSLENEANLVYCIASSLEVVANELAMLICIKEDKMDAAWAHLVRAQTLIGTVVRNHPLDGSQLDGQVKRLAAYETLLFPPMFFQSQGSIILVSECSICYKNLNDCDHLKGKLYMGELCCRIIKKQQLEEVSSVDHPANKLCRIIAIQSGGKKWDTMTLRPLPVDPEKRDEDLIVGMIL